MIEENFLLHLSSYISCKISRLATIRRSSITWVLYLYFIIKQYLNCTSATKSRARLEIRECMQEEYSFEYLSFISFSSIYWVLRFSSVSNNLSGYRGEFESNERENTRTYSSKISSIIPPIIHHSLFELFPFWKQLVPLQSSQSTTQVMLEWLEKRW